MCEGLKHMHSFDPPYAHNDVKPGNVLITWRKGQAPVATLMDLEVQGLQERKSVLVLRHYSCRFVSVTFYFFSK